MPSNLKRYQSSGGYHFITFSCYRRYHYLNNDPALIIIEVELEKLRQRHQFYLFGGWPTHKSGWPIHARRSISAWVG